MKMKHAQDNQSELKKVKLIFGWPNGVSDLSGKIWCRCIAKSDPKTGIGFSFVVICTAIFIKIKPEEQSEVVKET